MISHQKIWKILLFQVDVQTGQAFDNFGKFEIIEDTLR